MSPDYPKMRALVTLLTDFGTLDGYVGAMKGVILSRAPDATLVDLTHDIPPHDVWSGAWALREAARSFPAGAIHVAVVDPGVGTARRPILVEHAGQVFVGPDNGVLSLASSGGRARHLDRSELHHPQVSRTFHGRDIFAAVAGHLAAGLPPADCGTPIADWLRLEELAPSSAANGVRGAVIHVDRFGNLVTNITTLAAGARVEVEGGPSAVPLRATFGDVAPGEWVAYLGSSGRLELAVREGSAAARLGGQVNGLRVTLCAD